MEYGELGAEGGGGPAGELTPDGLRLYEYAAAVPSFTPTEAGDALGLARPELARALEHLEALRLLRRDADEACRYAVVSPEFAAGQLLWPMERRIRQQSEDVERIRTTFAALGPCYQNGRQGRQRAEVEVLTDLEDVRRLIDGLADNCRTEALHVQPGGARDPEALLKARASMGRLLERGVSSRSIYQHPARYSQHTVEFAEWMMERGAQVRTLADGPDRMLIYDRKVAVVSVQGNSAHALVVYEPNLVAFMVSSFETAWRAAAPFPVGFDREWAKQISDDLRQSIVRLLAEGLDDKSIARRLGMSMRTVQRHVAEIMRTLDAKSRFQTGYLVGLDEVGISDR
ncbi:helix-turn-helix transcriptional regulator [Streptomyces sp. SP17BM10]|uniref:helix-turn-helix transcriptional regulator n=1 Tax=Streptomyces sp. SP17BM10 TaxID=3002530 RepID=UPI002E7A7AF2|nr:helix-turn-helix transcriptional regulator [Streptomyces sp. SP17BM10]MEE1783414.1 helix-turn-helix transcriptional regulator [Streptomyces sp. SP17BM10]